LNSPAAFMPSDSIQAVRDLIGEIDHYLAGLTGELAGVTQVRRGIAAFGHGPVRPVPPQPHPACGYLDEALAASDAHDLKHRIQVARALLHWTVYNLYPRAEIGERWPEAHAMVSLVGGDGFIPADDFELGLFLMAPQTLYRDHCHPAPELYVPMTGPHGWRFGPDTPWIEKPAHAPIWNEPNAIHATWVREVPFLCLYGWTRDVNAPAKVVPASDWDVLETHL
jgi:Dimethlysulfonioproprionate lyase